jgi:hypothetical protein
VRMCRVENMNRNMKRGRKYDKTEMHRGVTEVDRGGTEAEQRQDRDRTETGQRQDRGGTEMRQIQEKQIEKR